MLFACVPSVTKSVETETDDHDHPPPPHDPVNRAVDILLVIDNSGSMAQEQANLVANLGAFIEVLEADDVRADYRIGITTTDNGNPRCRGTSPEGGKLQVSSCRSRPDDFTFLGNPPVEAFDVACASVCSEESDAALADGLLPTTTDKDLERRPRPWIESIGGETNLPGGLSPTEALGCLGPQGIAGCGMEQPLESMYKAIALSSYPESAQLGFVRDQAILAIIIVTDEADCSHNNAFDEVFSENKVFWSDPDAQFPTSAVCWNAGVACVGDGNSYDDCLPTNFDMAGTPGVLNGDAVMRPLGRYTEFVEGIENWKKDINPEQEVVVAVISGVPEGYSDKTAQLEFADSDDPAFQEAFGIGPGCEVGERRAVPPVRLRVFAEAFNSDPEGRPVYSICAPDYTPALEAIAEAIAVQVRPRPSCYRQCAADRDESTPELEPACILEYTDSDYVTQEVPQCVLAGDEYVLPDDDSSVCWVPLVTPEPGEPESMSPACVEQGWNLEFGLVWEGDVPIAPSIRVTCELSAEPELDCPGLP